MKKNSTLISTVAKNLFWHRDLPAICEVSNDELRQLKEERDQLQQEVLRLRLHLQAHLDQPSDAKLALC